MAYCLIIIIISTIIITIILLPPSHSVSLGVEVKHVDKVHTTLIYSARSGGMNCVGEENLEVHPAIHHTVTDTPHLTLRFPQQGGDTASKAFRIMGFHTFFLPY